MTILITGATGRPGGATVREFARRGTPVRALVRDTARAQQLTALPGVELAVGDMLWPETLERALDGVDTVLMISSAGPLMLETQATFIDAAVRAGVRHLIKLSGDDGQPGFDPERFRSTRSHQQIQRYLKASGLPWTVLAPSQFMQVYLEEAATIAAAGELRLPMGGTALAPIDVEDIGRIAYTVLTTPGHEGRTYSMTGPESLTMAEIADRIAAGIDRPVRYVDVEPSVKRDEWLAAGYPPPRADAFGQLFAERRRHGAARVDLSSHRTFDVAPTTFAAFAAREAAAFRAEANHARTPV
jgi:uncharacterized protein YbjT (DUF2867 family)